MLEKFCAISQDIQYDNANDEQRCDSYRQRDLLPLLEVQILVNKREDTHYPDSEPSLCQVWHKFSGTIVFAKATIKHVLYSQSISVL